MDALFFFVTPVVLGVVLAALKERAQAQVASVVAHFGIQSLSAVLAYQSEVAAGFVRPASIFLFYGAPAALLLLVLALRPLRSRPLALVILTPIVLIAGYTGMTALLIFAGWLKP